MEALFHDGSLVNVIIALTVVEGFALALYHRITGRGVPPRDYALNLLAGLFLMLAIRGVLTGAGWYWTASALAAAGIAHCADLWSRWLRQKRDASPF
ncbi:MAG: hypothetical protein CVU30_11085 [Betaproteobacteria bacterium HGW-Betaproteobacteria-3]|jgi:hypothetical protein|nr:MAG: hypothetical protein CVU30_11085 [Betaproteobacteria bacterium HGW-Betaproteobacteria-3]